MHEFPIDKPTVLVIIIEMMLFIAMTQSMGFEVAGGDMNLSEDKSSWMLSGKDSRGFEQVVSSNQYKQSDKSAKVSLSPSFFLPFGLV